MQEMRKVSVTFSVTQSSWSTSDLRACKIQETSNYKAFMKRRTIEKSFKKHQENIDNGQNYEPNVEMKTP